ncbi:fumarate hydratase [Halarsenatibacter silvermanii]|uniref:Fumarase, class I alpha subunit n=1 Tax=Halarsenatibacter silvermanii TaxID=321763 RepID=A0A1G9MD85_9FIRM|nr:fumarate hydratase [Halarsenatibacter silvermanii]SDL72094.1 fumarase, class I alpha subunit [Halarsenatibacter silvermanii]
MRKIEAENIISEVKQACIEAACDLPEDVEAALHDAKEKEESEFGRYSLDNIIENFELAREEMVPMCQDTGLVVVYATIGEEVQIEGGTLVESINQGVSSAYRDHPLRKSVVEDPVFDRENTEDNTPAIIYPRIVEGDDFKLEILPKGAGSENMGDIAMLKPADGVEGVKEFVIDTVVSAGGNPCPPVVVGVGIGGTMEKSTMLAKEALSREIDSSNPDSRYQELEEEILEEINKSGVGPQGLGGRNTALSVNIETHPTHIATLPVAVNLNCHAARHKIVKL